MSYAWLIGVVVGVLVAVGMIVIAGLLGRKLLRQECDERTRLIQTQAGATAFAITSGPTWMRRRRARSRGGRRRCWVALQRLAARPA
jgi:hypothetical protein